MPIEYSPWGRDRRPDFALAPGQKGQEIGVVPLIAPSWCVVLPDGTIVRITPWPDHGIELCIAHTHLIAYVPSPDPQALHQQLLELYPEAPWMTQFPCPEVFDAPHV